MNGQELFEKEAKKLQYDKTWGQMSDEVKEHWERKASGLPIKPLSCPNPECDGKNEDIYVEHDRKYFRFRVRCDNCGMSMIYVYGTYYRG